MDAEVIDGIMSVHAEFLKRMPELGTGVRNQNCARIVIEHFIVNRWRQQILKCLRIKNMKEIDTVGSEVLSSKFEVHI